MKYLKEEFTNDNINIKNIQDKFENLSFLNRDLRGASTTICTLVVEDKRATIYYSGDSRVYLFRNNKIIQLTTDHTQLNKMLQNNEITPKEAQNLSSIYDMLENYLVIGEFEDFFVDIKRVSIEKEDKFLLCTDGVWETFDNDFLKDISSLKIDKLAQKIYKYTKKKNSDNFSFILFGT